MPDKIKQIRSAHHEPGHVVVAAVQGLKLRPEGIMIDPSGYGLGCFDKEIYGSDDTRKRVVAAMFGGYYAERRFCNDNSYAILEPRTWFLWNDDGKDAAKLAPPSDFFPLMVEAERIEYRLHPLLKRLGIPACGLNGFRHTMASLLVSQGASPAVAQRQLRHSDPMTTLRNYTHLVGSEQREAVEKVADVLRPTSATIAKEGQWTQ